MGAESPAAGIHEGSATGMEGPAAAGKLSFGSGWCLRDFAIKEHVKIESLAQTFAAS